MLFDKPTSALDPGMVKAVLTVIQGLACSGMTMLIVRHEMKFARNTADTIYFMDDGQLVEKTEPEQFFSAPQSEREGGEVSGEGAVRWFDGTRRG